MATKKAKKRRVNNLSTGRSYVKDTIRNAKPSEKKRRAGRNAARRKMMKAGRVRKGDGMDIDHKNKRPTDNSPKNLRVISKSKNRSIK